MLNNKILKLFYVLCAYLLIASLFSCNDEVADPCGKDVNIGILTKIDKDCDGECESFAEGADVMILKDGKLLDSLKLNEKGFANYSVPESGCGTPEGYIFAINYDGKFVSIHENISIASGICRDTIVELCIDACKPDSTRSCEDFINIFEQKIKFYDKNRGEDECILIHTPKENLINNVAGFKKGGADLKIDVKPILEYNKNRKVSQFKYSGIMTPKPQNNIVIIDADNPKINIPFEFTPNELGVFSDTITLNVECIDEDGQTIDKGIWKINLYAEVCEPVCDCPFPDVKLEYKADFGRVEEHTSVVMENIEIFTIYPNMLTENCCIVLDSIVRLSADSDKNLQEVGNAYTILPEQENFTDFKITAPTNFKDVDLTKPFTITADFNPESMQTSRDTFRVKLLVIKCNNEELVTDECYYDFILQGNGCQNICPDLIYEGSNFSKEKLTVNVINNNDNSQKRELLIGDAVEFKNKSRQDSTIDINFKTMYATPCAMDSIPYIYFKLEYRDSTILCVPEEKLFTLRQLANPANERDEETLFDAQITPVRYTDYTDYYIEFRFNPISFEEHKKLEFFSKDNIANTRFEIVSADGECYHIFNLKADLKYLNYSISPTWAIEAFSQITAIDSIPDYHTAKIDLLSANGYYGVPDNNPPSVNAGNLAKNNHTFFINVDSPTNILPTGQKPKLFMVNDLRNTFDYILPLPIAKYANENAFADDVDNLVADITNSEVSSFTSRTTPSYTVNRVFNSGIIDWEIDNGSLISSRSKNTFGNLNTGIDINVGDVYLIWDIDDITENWYIDNRTYICKVALLYISEIGEGIGGDDNNNNRASMHYKVIYPITFSF
jgi:hypothetical protein